MNKKQALIFILLIAILLIFNQFLRSTIKTPSALTSQDLINHDQISSQKLVNKTWKIIKTNYHDPSLNNQKWELWKEHYAGQIKTDEDAYIAINTMLTSLDDPYSKYMSKKEYNDQNTSIDSKITGIGVNISSIAGNIYVVNVIEGAPASLAQVQVGDMIMKINEKNVKGMQLSDVANIVRGPENSTVELTLLRKNVKLIKKIKRKEIKIKTVKYSIEKQIGYIQILSFIGASTPSEFIEALEKTKNTHSLIIDLRGNPGGLLPNAIFIANMFIEDGNLVSIVGRNGYKKNIEAQKNIYKVEKPMILLVDGYSASASEILAGALKDYKKATIVGTKTFGKGMVQKIIPLQNETGLNLTIAKYLTPNGTDIDKKGIIPDKIIPLDEAKSPDTQLDTAKNLLKNTY